MLGAFAGAFCEALVDAFAAALVGAFFVEARALATAAAFAVAFAFSLGLDALVVFDFGVGFFTPVGLPFGSASLGTAFFVGGFVDAFVVGSAVALAGALVEARLGVVAGFATVALLAMVLVLPPSLAKVFIVLLCFAVSVFTTTGSWSCIASRATWAPVALGEGLVLGTR